MLFAGALPARAWSHPAETALRPTPRTSVLGGLYPPRLRDNNTELVIAHTSSGVEAIAGKVAGAPVVSAFGTVPSEVRLGVYDPRRRKATRPSLIYCGDDTEAKEVAAALICEVGFDPLDSAPLRIARLSRARKARERKVSRHNAEDDQTDYLRWFAGRSGEFFAFFLK